MFQTAYATHPTYFDYRTPPQTPQRAAGYNNYYSPRQYSFSSTPHKGHTRRPTADAAFSYNTTSYSTPRKSNYYTGPEYSSPTYYTSAQSTPQRKSDYVSGSARTRDRARSHRTPAGDGGRQQRKYSTSGQYHSSRTQFVYDDSSDPESEYLPRYEQYERYEQPPPYQRHYSYHESRTDRRYRDQVPIYTRAEPTESRPRRASYSAYNTAKPTYTSTKPHRPSTATKSPPKATDADARRAGIPAGYCFKNWDPTEEPILLLGSVFDANSLGKWIYDWTVFFFGPTTPMSEIAGDLWLLLIKLAGKVKRAEECLPRVRQQHSRDLVDDFLESGERLWQRFNELLKICENYMLKAAKKEKRSGSKLKMGKNSGCEFVEAIFGRDRELERTQRWMASMVLWEKRFDANLEDILRNPSA
jgi:hypothetical protein